MKKKSSLLVLLAILSINFIQTGPNAVSPALDTIFAAFAGLPVTTLLLISTLPSLLSLPGTLLTGAIAGKKIKYRTLALVGTALFFVSGVAPAFANNYTLILVERSLFGLAVGIIAPLGAAMIQTSYEGDKQARYLGIGTLAMNLGGISLTLISGVLATFGWNTTFYVYAMSIITFVLVFFFLREPQLPTVSKPQESQEGEIPQKAKVTVPAAVWIASILFGLLFMLNYTVLINTSALIAQREFGDSAVAGIAISLFTGGGIMK